jgi:hypothetical protein
MEFKKRHPPGLTSNAGSYPLLLSSSPSPSSSSSSSASSSLSRSSSVTSTAAETTSKTFVVAGAAFDDWPLDSCCSKACSRDHKPFLVFFVNDGMDKQARVLDLDHQFKPSLIFAIKAGDETSICSGLTRGLWRKCFPRLNHCWLSIDIG